MRITLESVQQAGDLLGVGNVNGDRSGIMQQKKEITAVNSVV